MVLTFNVILRAGQLCPSKVRLVRHKAKGFHPRLLRAAIDRHPDFETYQSTQVTDAAKRQFRDAGYLAGFIVDHAGAEVFVGVWRLLGERPDALRCPFTGDDPPADGVHFDTERLPQFDHLCGRLKIDWGPATRAWIQRADNQTKPVVELRSDDVDPPFPGFMNLECGLNEVCGFPSTWESPLRSTRGIYLLRHRTGALYVGSATGSDGLLGRWLSYSNGHGGNRGLSELRGEAADYRVCVLETAGSGDTDEVVLRMEARWKERLQSREHGLNRN